MEESTVLSERRFDLAKQDALATYAPRGVVFGSGFLAGFVITWLPLLLYLVLFIWEALFGSVVPGESKFQVALGNLWNSWKGYAAAAWLPSLAVGGFGVLLAYLRALSCLINSYVHFETRNGEIRLGLHQLLGLFGVPIVVAVVLHYVIGNPTFFFVMLVPIVISGLVFNTLFQALQNGFLRRFYRPDYVDLTVQGLKVYIPRHVGASHVEISDIRVDRERKMTEVFGRFDDDATRREVRQIVSHFLRGYDPVHVRDVEGGEAS